jgi:hypothetical protein
MERTAEFRFTKVTKDGTSLDYIKKTYNQGGKRTTFNQERRWRDPQFYCKFTGESAFLGPGSYNDHENFKNMNRQPCSALMKKIGILEDEESKKQCYIMVG